MVWLSIGFQYGTIPAGEQCCDATVTDELQYSSYSAGPHCSHPSATVPARHCSHGLLHWSLIQIGEPRYSTSSSTTSPTQRTRSTSDSPAEPQTASSSEPSCSGNRPLREPFPCASPSQMESDSSARSIREFAETMQELPPWRAKLLG